MNRIGHLTGLATPLHGYSRLLARMSHARTPLPRREAASMKQLLLTLVALLLAIPVLAQDTGNRLTFVTWSPDSRQAVSGDLEGTLRVWDASTGRGRPLAGRHPGSVIGAAFRDASTLVSWSYNDVRVDPLPGGTGRSFRVPDVRRARLSPDGRTLALAGFGQIELWDVTAGRRRHVLPLDTRRGGTLAFDASGARLAASRGPAAVLFDTATGRRLGKLQKDAVFEISDLAFTPRGTLLTLDSHSVREWEVPSGRPLQEAAGLAFDGSYHLRLAPDGRALLAAGYRDGAARGWLWRDWSVPSGRVLLESSPVDFLRGGERVVSTGQPAGGGLPVTVSALDGEPTARLRVEFPAGLEPWGVMIPPLLAASPDGTRFAVAIEESLLLVDLERR